MIYTNSEGKPDPLVEVSVKRGNWTAESNSSDCEQYVNGFIQKRPYNGISDEEWLVEIMQKHGFERAGSRRDPDRDPAPTEVFIFDHIETAAAM